jgi:biopolymer transport protein TolQ
MQAHSIIPVLLAPGARSVGEGVVAVSASGSPATGVAQEMAPDYGFLASILNAGLSEQIIMGLLGFVSVISWAIIVYKWRSLRKAHSQSEAFLDNFWGSKRLDAIFKQSESLSISPISQVFRAGYIELAKLRKRDKKTSGTDEETNLGHLESIERSMRRAALAERTGLESMITFLATTGSSAPFIGLLGTVLGIINSFQEIGAKGDASLATVAPGIGGALVATAFGLFAAIPAVIAYNYFNTRIRVLDTEMANFASDFLNIIKRHFF